MEKNEVEPLYIYENKSRSEKKKQRSIDLYQNQKLSMLQRALLKKNWKDNP